jgi:hypothetical protein
MSDELTVVQERDAVVSREQIAANLRAWILDLRTTDAKQGKGRLHRVDEDSYCCLGRACVATGVRLTEQKDYVGDLCRGIPLDYGVDLSGLTYAVRELLGLQSIEVSDLIRMNDTAERTFAEIADYIEQEILPRYSE